jgi:hypothetical protein
MTYVNVMSHTLENFFGILVRYYNMLVIYISCEYSEKIGLVEKIVILFLIYKIFPNSCLKLISNSESVIPDLRT